MFMNKHLLQAHWILFCLFRMQGNQQISQWNKPKFAFKRGHCSLGQSKSSGKAFPGKVRLKVVREAKHV